MVQENLVWHEVLVSRRMKEAQNGHRSAVLWFTGLPSSGKSTIALSVEKRLYDMGVKTMVLDGDNVRHGLCSNLGFTMDDRKENIRRIGEVAKLFIEAGVITMTAFISPLREYRDAVRALVGNYDFIEIYCDCSIDVCEQRDVKGHYKKARAGEIKEFTGVSSPYEAPELPEIVLKTDTLTIEQCSEQVVQYLKSAGILSNTA
ncbi:adenylyl-sulfate kinase [Candidatus Magnetomonas plexicatena]|uniref:adenylyl-sulfate kinase n=1 Tax=Candidatus Magnetomonas plexicatena TaxID=2552947 RepID=UPI001C74D70B|nr:adenylyl-sulfate kinase [Nitrospirales bacterium LBB_01]